MLNTKDTEPYEVGMWHSADLRARKKEVKEVSVYLCAWGRRGAKSLSRADVGKVPAIRTLSAHAAASDDNTEISQKVFCKRTGN